MPTITSFISLSLDGCYADANGEMNWAHTQDPEQQAFTNIHPQGGGRLVFGHATYDMMASLAHARGRPDDAGGRTADERPRERSSSRASSNPPPGPTPRCRATSSPT